MPAPKGTIPPNAGKGRKAGVPNKTTGAVREAFQRLVEDNAGKLQEWLDATAEKNPDKAIELVVKLAEFLVPKLSRSELRGADDGRLTIEIIRQGGPPPEATP